MLLGMAVAVAAFVTVVSLVISLRDTLDDRLARYGASLLVVPASPELSLEYGGLSVADAGSGEVPVLHESAVATILGIPSAARVAEAIPVLLQPVQVAGETYLALGTDVAAGIRAKPWWRIEGAPPRGPYQVLLGLDARNKLGLDPGETLTIEGRQYVVSGVLWETGGEEDGVIVMDREELAQLTGRGADVNLIEVTAGDSDAVEPLSLEISKALPAASVISVKKSLEFNAQANGALGKFGLAATALIIIVSAFHREFDHPGGGQRTQKGDRGAEGDRVSSAGHLGALAHGGPSLECRGGSHRHGAGLGRSGSWAPPGGGSHSSIRPEPVCGGRRRAAGRRIGGRGHSVPGLPGRTARSGHRAQARLDDAHGG